MSTPIAHRPIFWCGIAAFFITALSAWWLHTYKRVAKEIDLPLRGAASYNPLYALQKTLENAGLKVQSHADLRLNLLQLQPHDTLLVEGHIQQLSQADAQKLLQWVHDGGHLLTSLPVAEVLAFGDEYVDSDDVDSEASEAAGYSNDSDDSESASNSDDFNYDDDDGAEDADTEFVMPGRNSAVLRTLKIEVRESLECARLIIATHKSERSWCPKSRFVVAKGTPLDWHWAWGDTTAGYVLGRAGYGSGTVTLASSFKLLSSKSLKRKENQVLARQLFVAAVARNQAVHIIYGHAVPPFYTLLIRWAWPVLLPLALALLLWAYARAARFGPLRAFAYTPRRALSEHIGAAGEFAFRRGRFEMLYQSMRDAALTKLFRKHPQLRELEGSALAQEIAVICALPQAQVHSALFPAALERIDAFTAAISTLIVLRNQS
jgi:hypothetical protein